MKWAREEQKADKARFEIDEWEERFEERLRKQNKSRSDFHFRAEKCCLRGFEASEVEIMLFMSSVMNLVSVFLFPLGVFGDVFEVESSGPQNLSEISHFGIPIFADCRGLCQDRVRQRSS